MCHWQIWASTKCVSTVCKQTGKTNDTYVVVVRHRVDAVYAEKHESVHDEWVMSLHQLLPPEDNWMWTLATQPRLLDLVRRHLVRSLSRGTVLNVP